MSELSIRRAGKLSQYPAVETSSTRRGAGA